MTEAREDRRWMTRALELAARGRASTQPNPRVGCVLVRDGAVVAEAWHQRAGEPHAEALALRAAGAAARGATAYVTLEPCSHFGRTPPCADALVAAGVVRVVAAMKDPDPRVAGRGLARLAAAGIAVDVGTCAAQAAELNRPFLSRQLRQRPWLVLKLAASLDGRTALADGSSRWITGEAARADVHRFRAELGAVLSTAATVLADDSRLTVRLPGAWRQPDRVVLDRRGRVPATARVWDQGARRIAVIGNRVAVAHRDVLAARGVEVVEAGADGDGHLRLRPLLEALGSLQINGLLVECGPHLAGSLLAASLVDELLLYVAPRLLGSAARPLAELASPATLDEASRWGLQDVEQVGDDLRLRLKLVNVDASDPLEKLCSQA
ncbi:MAG TPA: bifunctional diaminohydroxyphosphoribosylaminopyrimidine deaminase/5-amino-6-(5-phosphoribosylamino)uracil reductase RibD [Nevskiaceae bacterium]